MRYLAGWRIQLAKQLLKQLNMSIVEVAERVGYESEAAFNRAFRRHVGLPPAAWARAARSCQAGIWGSGAAPPSLFGLPAVSALVSCCIPVQHPQGAQRVPPARPALALVRLTRHRASGFSLERPPARPRPLRPAP